MSYQTAGRINVRNEGELAQRGLRCRVSLTFLKGLQMIKLSLYIKLSVLFWYRVRGHVNANSPYISYTSIYQIYPRPVASVVQLMILFC